MLAPSYQRPGSNEDHRRQVLCWAEGDSSWRWVGGWSWVHFQAAGRSPLHFPLLPTPAHLLHSVLSITHLPIFLLSTVCLLSEVPTSHLSSFVHLLIYLSTYHLFLFTNVSITYHLSIYMHNFLSKSIYACIYKISLAI